MQVGPLIRTASWTKLYTKVLPKYLMVLDEPLVGLLLQKLTQQLRPAAVRPAPPPSAAGPPAAPPAAQPPGSPDLALLLDALCASLRPKLPGFSLAGLAALATRLARLPYAADSHFWQVRGKVQGGCREGAGRVQGGCREGRQGAWSPCTAQRAH
jgi:hypothetical protein